MGYQELLRFSVGNGREVLNACLSNGRRVRAQLRMCHEIQNSFVVWLLESSHETRCEVDHPSSAIPDVADTQAVQSLCDGGSEPKWPLVFVKPEAMVEFSTGSIIGRALVGVYDNQ